LWYGPVEMILVLTIGKMKMIFFVEFCF